MTKVQVEVYNQDDKLISDDDKSTTIEIEINSNWVFLIGDKIVIKKIV